MQQDFFIMKMKECKSLPKMHPITLETPNLLAACFDLHFSVFMQLEEAFLLYVLRTYLSPSRLSK